MSKKNLKTTDKFGQPTGVDYEPAISPRIFRSKGTAQTSFDWFTGRKVYLLSQVEMRTWYSLRWNDQVEDVREQFPLDYTITKQIAEEHGIRHPNDKGTDVIMTTDFLVTLKDGRHIAIYVKHDKSEWENNNRTCEKAFIEKLYWTQHHKVDFIMVTNDMLNPTLCTNIATVTQFYDIKHVYDRSSLLKHRIAHKNIIVDMESSLLNFKKLLLKYGGTL